MGRLHVNSASSFRLPPRRGALIFALSLCAFAVALAPCAAQLPGASMQSVKWPLRTREHVDLWLHGFVMISSDTSPVPLFRRGYREAVVAARTKASAVTDLDVNHDALARRLRENPALTNAQFLALAFPTWDELVAAIDGFVKADGDPKKAIASSFARSPTRCRTRRTCSSMRGGSTKCGAENARSRPST